MGTKDPETWMWERAREMLDYADRAHRQLFSPGRPGGGTPGWEPPVDIFETPRELWVLVALPGVAPDGIEVEVQGTGLRIHGVRPLPPAFRKAVVHRLEIPHGRFERCVDLPAGTYELIERRVTKGCLFLNLKKLAP